MPYIDRETRDKVHNSWPRTVGELNYTLHTVMAYYIDDKGLNYQTINDCIGVLECMKLELYRRLAAPYEDRKIKENGDVYPYLTNAED